MGGSNKPYCLSRLSWRDFISNLDVFGALFDNKTKLVRLAKSDKTAPRKKVGIFANIGTKAFNNHHTKRV